MHVRMKVIKIKILLKGEYMNKTIKLVLVSLLGCFMLAGCGKLTPEEKIAKEKKANAEKEQMISERIEKIEFGMYLAIRQAISPDQQEFSVSTVWGGKKKDESLEYYELPIGNVSKKIQDINENVLFKIQKSSKFRNYYYKYEVCSGLLKSLDKRNALYGYNLDSEKIVERQGEERSEKWQDRICYNYVNSDEFNTLYIMVRKDAMIQGFLK